MRRLIYFLPFIFSLVACGPSDDEKAMRYVDAAQVSLNEGNFSKAKLQIDSIKSEFPKAFNTRKVGILLMLDVEKQEQLKGIQFIDSLIEARTTTLEELLASKKYKFDKNEEYQEIGSYFASTQSIENNATRAYLRFSVNEKGKMTMTSFYHGSFPINHNRVKVTTKDKTFVETPPADNLYSSKNLGMVTERQDFTLGKDDGSVIDFIVENQETPLYITYLGERPYKFRLSKVDIDAAVRVEKLARVLASLNELSNLKAEANKKLEFIDKRLEHYEQENSELEERK